MEKEFLINAGPLATCIKALKPFISTEETRYYLNGIYFELEEKSDVLNMVATDGIKLCVLNVPVDRQELFDYGELKIIVPTKALETMLVMLKGIGADCPIAIRFNEVETKIYVDTPDEKGEFKLIEAEYPDYRKVIPTAKPKFTIGFGKVQAREALKALASSKDEEGLQWEMVDEKAPMVIRAKQKLVVVMPMRVSLPGETVGLQAEAPKEGAKSE